jgi:serine/threonine protein kinase
LQLTEGLKYIHSKDIIHRDIKPENILFSKTNPVVMKWADFGLSKLTNSCGSASVSGARGTKCWVPKEIIPFLRLRKGAIGRCSKQGDIFSAGCVFFFFLTGGVHPFGDDEYDDSIIHKNIVNGNIVNRNSKIVPVLYFSHISKMFNNNNLLTQGLMMVILVKMW